MNRTSRRQFLQALAAGTAAAPFLNLNAFAKATPGVLRHASFGAGGMAWNDLTQIAEHPDVRIVAICDVDLKRQKQAREKFLGEIARFVFFLRSAAHEGEDGLVIGFAKISEGGAAFGGISAGFQDAGPARGDEVIAHGRAGLRFSSR